MIPISGWSPRSGDSLRFGVGENPQCLKNESTQTIALYVQPPACSNCLVSCDRIHLTASIRGNNKRGADADRADTSTYMDRNSNLDRSTSKRTGTDNNTVWRNHIHTRVRRRHPSAPLR